MRGPQARPVVIAAGGTGGHFFPAEALAAELLARGHRVALMTDARSGALRSEIFAGGENFVLRGAGIAGRGAARAGRAVAALAAGTMQARAILTRLDAAVVVGFGGYPSVAPVLACRLLRRRPPVVLHEQNAVLGRANRFLAHRADVLALGFAQTARIPEGVATAAVGNPVRPAIRVLAGRPYSPPADGAVNLLVLGGSLGARVFSDVVPEALARLPDAPRARIRIVQQARAEDIARVRAAYAQAGIAAELSPFFPDVARHLAAAHLVISRAGASTVTELAVSGRPAILVPLPIAIDDHQATNAQALAEAGGAWMVRQNAFTPDALAARLSELFDAPAALSRAAAAAAGQGRADAAAALADLVESRIAGEAPVPARAGKDIA